MTEKTYYILTVFKDKNNWGKTLKNEYMSRFDWDRVQEAGIERGWDIIESVF